ncbi:hypothetical protein RRSWK_04050 [Rhodopirellula sp. SWK7]|nr:hypothetical protein RRSWK_04050 [Rhodopirellula sp. SWK7]
MSHITIGFGCLVAMHALCLPDRTHYQPHRCADHDVSEAPDILRRFGRKAWLAPIQTRPQEVQKFSV